MLATYRHVSPRHRPCLLKPGRRQMSPMPWLDSRLGHVLADMSPHNCPAISKTHWAITLMGVMVDFLEINGTYTWINTYDTIFTNFLHRITPLQCNFLWSFVVFSLCPKEPADMLVDVIPTWHVMSSDMVRTTEFDDMPGDISDIFPKCQECQPNMSFWGDQPTQYDTNISN